MAHPDYPSGFLDYAGELTIAEGLKAYKLKPEGTGNLSEVKEAIEKHPNCICYWKLLIDRLSANHEATVSFVVNQVKKSYQTSAARKEVGKAMPYVQAVLVSNKTFESIPKTLNSEYQKWVGPVSGIDSTVHKDEIGMVVQLCTPMMLPPERLRKLTSEYVNVIHGNYFLDYSFANSFRFGDKDVPNDTSRFRLESRRLALSYPARATPHFTIAMTSRKKEEAISECNLYLKLDKRSSKQQWRKLVQDRLFQLMK